MAGFQNFRSAFNGFRREDVVHYIEYMNNKHNSQIEQLNSQIQVLQAELAQAKASPAANLGLQTALDDANAKIAELETTLAEGGIQIKSGDELEAYRRAERAERMAQERATQIYNQANAVLAEASVKVENVSAIIGSVADGVTAQLREYQQTVDGTKATIEEAVAAIYAIRPEEE